MNVIYKTQNISPEELTAACNLVNQGKQLSIELDEERLRKTYFLVIAISQEKVIGVSSIKKGHHVAEIGYTAVCSAHRRKKIGQNMTKLLMCHALKSKIDILCGIVFKSNVANRGKLEKLGFFKVSEFLSRSGKTILCWYCHPMTHSKDFATLAMENFLIAREKNQTI